MPFDSNNNYTDSVNIFPNFLIVGAQKAGTTALYEYLSKHPKIQPTKQKEIHYFNCDAQYNKGISFYNSFFQNNLKSKLTFDASPGYLSHPDSPQRIYSFNPNIKIIIILRNPIERAYSAWNMYQKRYLSKRDWFFDDWVSVCGLSGNIFLRRKDKHIFNFTQFVMDEIELQNANMRSTLLEAPILLHGYYYEHIERYYSLFNKNQILIIENVELRKKTIECLGEIEKFLCIPNIDWNGINLAPVFEGEYLEPIDFKAANILRDHYDSSNEQLFDLLDKRYNWSMDALFV